jgi:hypothetical protein
MIEIKIERRNGTMIDSAAFIPATIITNEASIKSSCEVLTGWFVIEFITVAVSNFI